MTIIESVLPAIAKPLYRAIAGTTADEIRLVYRGSAWWLLIKDGTVTKLVRIPYDDIEEFSLLLDDADLNENQNLRYIRERLNQILEEKIA